MKKYILVAGICFNAEAWKGLSAKQMEEKARALGMKLSAKQIKELAAAVKKD